MQIESGRFQGLPSMNAEQFATRKLVGFPRIIEFELSNTCNLQCVMCTGRVSSSIRKNRENLDPLPFPYDDNFVEQLKEFIPHLKQAYFFGGEPFLIEIYYKIWDQIIKINPKIRLYAVTNGTVMNDRVKRILKSTNFNAIISLDSLVNERAESIRIGSNLDEVKKNISIFKELSKNKIPISHTPMTINWFDTPDIIKFCNQTDSLINLSYVEGPPRFALWSMMPEQLNEVYSFYEKVEWKGNNKSFKAKYNIKVFNEWKNQVLFFKNRNQEILKSYTDINSKWDKETAKVNEFFQKLQNITEIDYNQVTQMSEIFNELLNNIEPTPWHLQTLKNVTGSLIVEEILKSDQFKEFLKNPEKIKTLFDNSGQADFFKMYY
jgi:MoaA/NifB/PqqE/SkfB family radical SAM enzyme